MTNKNSVSSEIILEEVSKQFPASTKPALDHISFMIEAGKLIVLLGPSGCGKTTLMKMINRLYEPSHGNIFIGGKDIREIPITELRRQIGYVIQQVGLFPHMNNGANISIVPKLLKWDQERIDRRVNDLMEMIGLPKAYLTRYPRQLSGGEQQRIGLARALAADPDILLMDEPFAAIDAITRDCLQEELLDIQKKVHKTVIFVTHDVEEAFRLADKIVVMKDGKLVQYGTPLDIITHPQNNFVRDLVGTENMLRRLSLLDVGSILEARESWASQAAIKDMQTSQKALIHPEDDLRTALSSLLDSGTNSLTVIDKSGSWIGEVSFGDLRAALLEHAPESQDNSEDGIPLS